MANHLPQHIQPGYRERVPDPLAVWWRRQSSWPSLSVADLVVRKGRSTVSVVIPALNEERTVAGVVAPLVEELVTAGLVDEVLVVDGGSTDRTAARAEQAGATVLHLPGAEHDPRLTGKGGALWWAQQQARGDLLVFLDADVQPSRSATVAALLTPLLVAPEVAFVKAAFDRPLTVDGVLYQGSGGRVTELLARPVLSAWWPLLTGFVQPLSGELAVRRDLLSQLGFATGYALEIAMLIDVLELVGLEAMAQVDIGRREHRHQSDARLGQMSAEVLAAALDRRGQGAAGQRLLQYARSDDGFTVQATEIRVAMLPSVDALNQKKVS